MHVKTELMLYDFSSITTCYMQIKSTHTNIYTLKIKKKAKRKKHRIRCLIFNPKGHCTINVNLGSIGKKHPYETLKIQYYTHTNPTINISPLFFFSIPTPEHKYSF